MQIVLKLDFDKNKVERLKQKAMETAAGILGVDSVTMDIKEKQLTVIGDVDPVKVVRKLRKLCHTEVVSVGPVSAPDNNLEQPLNGTNFAVAELVKANGAYINPCMPAYYNAYNYPRTPIYHDVRWVENDPYGCSIT